jgi:hypothetical protein
MPTNDEDDDEGALARRHAADMLKVFAEIADNPRSKPEDRESARKSLEEGLLRLKRSTSVA